MNKRIEKIKLLALDVDGVLTTGKIIVDDEGKEIKIFDVHDGLALALLKKTGLKTAIITAKGSPAVRVRAKDLKIDKVYLDAFPKIKAYEKMLKDFKVSDEEVCYIGDDLPDVKVLERVGFAVAVPNAVAEVKKVCDYITQRSGGCGAVREIIELILKTQGKWEAFLK
ncbi:MAG: HAD-IIIA family hydrolase [Candidatus Omnitrophota bacterium]